MQTLSADLAAQLAGGATTLCRCWLLTRRDGEQLGLTDHDAPLQFAGVTYKADAGMRASALERNHHLAQEGMEIFALLSAEELREEDLLRGLYDGASLSLWLVDWENTRTRVRLTQGRLGKVRREGSGFQVELQSASADLHQERARVFRKSCDATLGDARCRVRLTATRYTKKVTVHKIASPTDLYVHQGGVEQDGWFAGGYVVATPRRDERHYLIRASVRVNLSGLAYHHLRLWTPFPYTQANKPPWVHAVPGCDKQFLTCRDKFANVPNFRGHPHLPGDVALVNPVR